MDLVEKFIEYMVLLNGEEVKEVLIVKKLDNGQISCYCTDNGSYGIYEFLYGKGWNEVEIYNV